MVKIITLSIIIPAYNLQNNIHVTIESLIAQTDKDFEVILVNDGSTDNTVNVVQNLLKNNPIQNFKIINKKNGGVSSARNIGLHESVGKYVFFLDGDDYISKDMVSLVNHYIKKDVFDVIAWGYNNVSEDKTLISNYFDANKMESNEMSGTEALENILFNKTMKVWTCSAIYKRSFLFENSLEYTEGCTNGEDLEFTFKALSHAKKVYFIKKILSFYIQRKGSITNSFSIKKFDAINAMERTAEYMQQTDSQELAKLADYIGMSRSVEAYITNFISFSRYRINGNDRLKASDVKQLMNEVEKAYPGLNKRIKQKIRKLKTVDFKTKIRYYLFYLSPFHYMKIINLYEKSKLK